MEVDRNLESLTFDDALDVEPGDVLVFNERYENLEHYNSPAGGEEYTVRNVYIKYTKSPITNYDSRLHDFFLDKCGKTVEDKINDGFPLEIKFQVGDETEYKGGFFDYYMFSGH